MRIGMLCGLGIGTAVGVGLAAPVPPPPPKTPVELVVGTWVLVRTTMTHPNDKFDLTVRYDADGKRTTWIDIGLGPKKSVGEYKVVDGELWHKMPPSEDFTRVAITRLDSTALVTTNRAGEVTEYGRAKAGK